MVAIVIEWVLADTMDDVKLMYVPVVPRFILNPASQIIFDILLVR